MPSQPIKNRLADRCTAPVRLLYTLAPNSYRYSPRYSTGTQLMTENMVNCRFSSCDLLTCVFAVVRDTPRTHHGPRSVTRVSRDLLTSASIHVSTIQANSTSRRSTTSTTVRSLPSRALKFITHHTSHPSSNVRSYVRVGSWVGSSHPRTRGASSVKAKFKADGRVCQGSHSKWIRLHVRRRACSRHARGQCESTQILSRLPRHTHCCRAAYMYCHLPCRSNGALTGF